MIKKTITAFLLAAALYAPHAIASIATFTPTTLTADQKFAANTIWYTLQIGDNGMYVTQPNAQGDISLNKALSDLADADLWCFVGNDTDGYRIYNKAAGANMVLAADPTKTGRNGGDALVTLKPANNLEGYVDLWSFGKSDKLTGKTAYFIYLKGKEAWKMNNRDGKLAFWTTGADHGSSLQILPLGGTIEVSPTTGTLTANGNSATYRALWTNKGDLPLTLNAGANNMNVANGILQLHSGAAKRGGYTFAMPVGYAVKSVDFDFKLPAAGKNVSIEANGKTTPVTTDVQHFSLKGDGKSNSLAFELVGDNTPVQVTNIKVVVERVKVELEPQTNLFPYTLQTPVTYRIPAIAVTGKSGTIVAVSDSRHTGTGDVGAGRVDLFATRSNDEGKTWDTPAVFSDAHGNPVAQGTGKKVNNDPNQSRDAGYGDAAIVADRESDDVLVLSVSGFTNFWQARRETPNAVARWYSKDGGKTFSAREDITDHIYKQFDGTTPRGKIESMFFGSGRIMQSHRTKVGSHYRVYAVMSGLNVNPTNIANWVMYSDDFGQNWKILGDAMTPAIPHSADEPKCEELPDGSIVVSSRRGSGRWFNVFRFTDSAKGEGYWDTMAHSPLVKATANACNGELLIVPVVKKATGKKMYLALQSVPFGPSGRTNVGINYKELAGYEDFGSSALFAKEWDGAHMSSYIGSAYSTMAWQKNNTLAFMYEEETLAPASRGGYTQVYKNYTIEQITDGAYSYAADQDFAVANGLRTEVLKARLAELKKNVGSKLGQISPEAFAGINEIADFYLANPSDKVYEVFNLAVKEVPVNEVSDKQYYYLQNEGYKPSENKSYYLKFTDDKAQGVDAYDEADETQFFIFYKVPNQPGKFFIYNAAWDRYLLPLQNQNEPVNTTDNQSEAGIYTLEYLPNGETLIRGVNGKNGTYKYLHMDRSKNLVCWNGMESAPSHWRIQETGLTTAISATTTGDAQTATKAQLFDLSGRKVSQDHKGLKVSKTGKTF